MKFWKSLKFRIQKSVQTLDIECPRDRIRTYDLLKLRAVALCWLTKTHRKHGRIHIHIHIMTFFI